MNNLDKQADIVAKVLEERAAANDTLKSWDCSSISEKYSGGVLAEWSGMGMKEAFSKGKKHFGYLALDETEAGLYPESVGIPLYSEMIINPSLGLLKYCKYDFPTILWDINTKKSSRSIVFNNDGRICLCKEGKSWPQKVGALVSYEGNYDVVTDDVSMRFSFSRGEGICPQVISTSLYDKRIVYSDGTYTVERNLETGVISMRILLVGYKENMVIEAKFESCDGFLQSGYLNKSSLRENGKVKDAILIISDTNGRRAIKAVPKIGRPVDSVLYEQMMEAIKELPEFYRDALLDYVCMAKSDECHINLNFSALNALEKKALELLGQTRGELILSGLTERVDNLIRIWNAQLGIKEDKKMKKKME